MKFCGKCYRDVSDAKAKECSSRISKRCGIILQRERRQKEISNRNEFTDVIKRWGT